ncbi:MAG TPA: hypothetical protein PK095_03895 [Myxococcota bacterium]|nr:hypothetical protein [Myxococcota bacterium]
MMEVMLAEGDDLEGALAESSEGGVLVLAGADFDGGLTLRKSVTIRGEGEATRVLGGRGSVFKVVGEGVVLTLEDLTVSEGSSELGGAVQLTGGASLVARRCRFEGNRARHKGGAVALGDGRCELSNCVIVGNRAGMGGGVYVDGLGTLVIDGGEVRDNDASTGAGVHVADGAEARLTGVIFAGQIGDEIDVSVAGSMSRSPEVVLVRCEVGRTAARPESALVIEP